MSSSSSQQQTQTTSNVQQVDNRVGIEGTGNILAQEGASVSVINNDVSFDVVDAATRANAAVSMAAIDANTATLDTSLRAQATVSQAAIASAEESARNAVSANSQVSQAAISAAQESARVAASAITQGQSRALDTVDRSLDTADRSVQAATGVAADATEAARQIVLANNSLTESTREGNQELVKLVADKLSTAVADERQNINAQVLDMATKAGAAVLGLVAVLYIFRRKSA